MQITILTFRKIFILLTVLFSLNLLGQKSDSIASKVSEQFLFSRKNSVNFETFGHGLYYSLSYERILINDYHFRLAVQAGAAVYPYPDQIDIWVPISINYIRPFGIKRKHHVEIGIGHILRYDQFYHGYQINPWQTFISGKLGYRYQKPNGRLIFKVLFTPFQEYGHPNGKSFIQRSNSKNAVEEELLPSGALSIGYTF